MLYSLDGNSLYEGTNLMIKKYRKMALINCNECGHEISDKAFACPNCGCPTENVEAAQDVVFEEGKNMKFRGWIWPIALILLICGGIYYLLSKNLIAGAFVEEKKDSIDVKNTIVEFTPGFIKAIEVYDELTPFNEGYAAVRRGRKWGYINTKGEEVISCLFDNAELFSEGLAAVCQDGCWGFIDTNGITVIPMKFEETPTPFSEGLAGFRRNNRWGWINKKGDCRAI